MPPTPSLLPHLANLDWPALEHSLDQHGCAVIRNLLPTTQCRLLSGLYANPSLFRSRVIMARHGFGRGEYQYFRYPLPDLIQQLRQSLYPMLVPLANRWNECMGLEVRYPHAHADFIHRCHAAGQSRPTPLLLQYGPQDYNCLHQDLYGEQVFPLQVAILLSEPGRDFTGGEFVLTEQRPRMQSRPQVIDLKLGDAVVFAVHQRPVKGVRGYYRVTMRHGVSCVHSGRRHTLGIIFHDAQ
ncbi:MULTISPECIES: 2OG-Fe(II) oxygenase [unclassified Pseudomonas]|uniref:2OG-Fe(II) oxygenase n=1 Tax=unclassified Pseudomonas TaxID=196821 RepID=UPI0030DAFC9C